MLTKKPKLYMVVAWLRLTSSQEKISPKSTKMMSLTSDGKSIIKTTPQMALGVVNVSILNPKALKPWWTKKWRSKRVS
jgi:hypothetical protein